MPTLRATLQCLALEEHLLEIAIRKSSFSQAATPFWIGTVKHNDSVDEVKFLSRLRILHLSICWIQIQIQFPCLKCFWIPMSCYHDRLRPSHTWWLWRFRDWYWYWNTTRRRKFPLHHWWPDWCSPCFPCHEEPVRAVCTLHTLLETAIQIAAPIWYYCWPLFLSGPRGNFGKAWIFKYNHYASCPIFVCRLQV